ncbi:unnamed protein product, partial [Rotaria sordida]
MFLVTTVETDYSTKEYFTTNEDLSNELIYEIFEFLDDHHVFQDPFGADMSLLLFPIIANLTQLTTFIINNIESNYIEHIFNHLASLIIISIDNIKNQNDIYYKIFRLPTLKYCQLLIETLR